LLLSLALFACGEEPGLDCVDSDGDRYGTGCAWGPDCDESNPAVHPGAVELCNGIDDNCDGGADLEWPELATTCDGLDLDQCSKGFWSCAADGGVTCEENGTNESEVCNGVDDDCDGQIDEDLADITCGSGLCAMTINGCVNGRLVSCAPKAPPEAYEVSCSDQLDNDCDGVADKKDQDCLRCADADDDAYAAVGADCPSGDDCVDGDPNIHPGAIEVVDGIDNNCDGNTDEPTASQYHGEVVFNEVLVDGNTPLPDANGDGLADPVEDEFVELLSQAAGPIDLSGWTLFDLTNLDPRHTFAENTVLPAGQTIVVFGGGTLLPSASGAQFVTAHNADVGLALGLSLNNPGDVLTLYDRNLLPVAEYGYGDKGALAAVQDESNTRAPEGSGSFIRHSMAPGANGARFSPGTRVDGSPFP